MYMVNMDKVNRDKTNKGAGKSCKSHQRVRLHNIYSVLILKQLDTFTFIHYKKVLCTYYY